jgi:hypothetical protein
VAIKKVLQDKRFKNRELQIMKVVDHPNIVKLKQCFYSHTEKDETFLHLVLEYVPDTVYRRVGWGCRAGPGRRLRWAWRRVVAAVARLGGVECVAHSVRRRSPKAAALKADARARAPPPPVDPRSQDQQIL